MKDILMQYRSEFSNSCIFVVNKDNVKLYGDDSILLEYINNIESNKNTISFKFKYLEETLKLFRRKRINYIVIDSDINYQIYDYYPSSQTCSRCNNQDKKYKNLNERIYNCTKCYLKLDRDLNASINIMFEGLKMYIKNNKRNILKSNISMIK